MTILSADELAELWHLRAELWHLVESQIAERECELAFLVGPTTAELQAKFGGDLRKLFLGKTVRVTGKVTRAPMAGGTAFQMAVTSSKDIEIVEEP